MHESAEVREGRKKEEGTHHQDSSPGRVGEGRAPTSETRQPVGPSWCEATDRGREREQLWENKRRLWS